MAIPQPSVVCRDKSNASYMQTHLRIADMGERDSAGIRECQQ